MKCSCCLTDGDESARQILELQLGLGVLVLCRECWLEFCSIAAKSLSGKDNPTREGTH